MRGKFVPVSFPSHILGLHFISLIYNILSPEASVNI